MVDLLDDVDAAGGAPKATYFAALIVVPSGGWGVCVDVSENL